jgi:3D-(3,5/4)-trihydroxycyclohexane-1,2-dione acylhydrolase (decyclizing)
VVLDNRGFGCINRLQMATGGANFNNLFRDDAHESAARDRLRRPCRLDGGGGAKAASIAELEAALKQAEATTAHQR